MAGYGVGVIYYGTCAITAIYEMAANCTYYEYNKNGEPTKSIRADGRSYTYQYDRYGKLSSATTYGGETITHEYTGRLLTKKTAGEEVTTYEYDRMERPISIRNREGENTYEYDTFGKCH